MRIRKRSSVTGVSSGAPRAFQSGKSSVSARGSMTAPDRMCAPTSEPFSSTHTETSRAAARGELLQADRRREARRGRRRRSPRRTPSLRGSWGSSNALCGRSRTCDAIIIGRPSPTGEPFRMTTPRVHVHTSRSRSAGGHGCARPRQQHGLLPLHGAGAHRMAVRVRGAGGATIAGTGPVIVNASCNFLRAARLPGRRRGADVPRRSGPLERRRATTSSLCDGAKYADGAAKIVWIDLATGRSTPLPESHRRSRCAGAARSEAP